MAILNFLFLPILEEMEKSRRIGLNDEGQEEDMDIQFFDLSRITKATDKLSVDNKFGECDFGPVYRVN
jgi:hypothetical protein